MNRDAALLKVRHLVAWHARRLAHRGLGDPCDLAQDITLRFLAQWEAFDGRPEHLGQFVKFAARDVACRVPWRRRRKVLTLPPAQWERVEPVTRDSDPGDAEQLGRVRAAVARLGHQDRDLLASRFGLDGREVQKLADLAAAKGVTRQAVHLRQRKALDRLLRAMLPTTRPA